MGRRGKESRENDRKGKLKNILFKQIRKALVNHSETVGSQVKDIGVVANCQIK